MIKKLTNKEKKRNKKVYQDMEYILYIGHFGFSYNRYRQTNFHNIMPDNIWDLLSKISI